MKTSRRGALFRNSGGKITVPALMNRSDLQALMGSGSEPRCSQTSPLLAVPERLEEDDCCSVYRAGHVSKMPEILEGAVTAEKCERERRSH